MNDDLKAGGGLGNLIDAPRAFVLAQLIALRVRDSEIPEAGKLAADAIATQIKEVADSWAVAMRDCAKGAIGAPPDGV